MSQETSKPADLLETAICKACGDRVSKCSCVKHWSPEGFIAECGTPNGRMYEDYLGKYILIADHVAEVERLTNSKKEAFALTEQTLEAAKAAGMELIQVSDYNYDFKNTRAELAESKLSQLQLANDSLSGALKVQKLEIVRILKELGEIQTRNQKNDQFGILGMTIGMRIRLGDTEKELTAILNGGQQ